MTMRSRFARHGRWIVLVLWMANSHSHAQVFYTVESPDGALGWLLGTIHTEDPRVLELPPALEHALDQADRVALELVPNAEMLDTLSAAMRLPREERLSELLEPGLHAEVLQLLTRYGLDAPAVDRMRPWAAAMTLALPPPETGLFMDMALAFRAARRGAEVVALETMEEQLGFLTGLGREAHIEMLELAVIDFERGRTLFETLVTTYLERDVERLREITELELERMGPAIRERFRREGIDDRNHRMVERATPLFEEGGTLVAVGALHLPGEAGLVALLRGRGYTVEAVY